MSYKRVVKKNGKVYGPYIYESYRDENGNVKKRYLGKREEKSKKNKLMYFLFGVLLLLAVFTIGYTTKNYAESRNIFGKITGFSVGNSENSSEAEYSVSFENSNEKENLVDDGNEKNPEIKNEIDTAEELIESVQEKSEEAEEANISQEIEETVLQENQTEVLEEVEQENQTVEELDQEQNQTEVVLEANQTEAENQTEIEIQLNETLLYNETQNQTIQNETLINISEINFSEVSTLQYKAVVGRPVKWIKRINVTSENLTVEIPKEAVNVSILTDEEIDLALEEIEDYEELVKESDKVELYKGSAITGNVVGDIANGQGILTKFWNWLTGFTITGNVIKEYELKSVGDITETNNSKILNLTKVANRTKAKKLAVEYYTQSPESFEFQFDKGKRMVVSAPSILNYTDVLVYSSVEKKVSMNDSNLRIYWYEDKENSNETIEQLLLNGRNAQRKSVDFEKIDLDGDGHVDYVEWVVPHLSNQVYEIIIEISKAEHLDENRNFIGDVYDKVSALDGSYATIYNGEYLRVTFEKPLDSSRDITIYAKSGNVSSIEVFAKNSNESLAVFENVSQEKYYKIYLSNLTETEDTFDLRVNGEVEFDYVLDPGFNITFVDPTPANNEAADNSSIIINASIEGSGLSALNFNWNGTNYSMYDNGLVLMMNFDNVSALGETSSYVFDVSGNGNNGTVYSATWGSSYGVYNGGFDFAGSNHYIDAGNGASLDITGNLSMEAWVYPTDTVTTQSVMGKYHSGSNHRAYALYLSSAGPDNTFDFWVSSDGSTRDSVSCNAVANEWQYISVVYDGTHMAIYRNGVLNISKSVSLSQINSMSYPFDMGKVDAATSYFSGRLDEVRVWNRSLSSEEIAQHYVSNLRKYDTNKWLLYVNQSNLSEGDYTYSVNAKDGSGNVNSTSRNVTVDRTTPTIDFVSPTNDSGVFSNQININVSAIDLNLDVIVIKLYNSTDDLIRVNESSVSPFYINYSGLDNGLYYYNATANDSAGNYNSTETRNITLDAVSPQFNFTSPTPVDGYNTTDSSQEFNATITEDNLKGLNWSWDGTNYSMYDENLKVMYNFDNVSSLGENDTLIKDLSGNGNDGSVSGATWTSSGKYRGGYSFDGSNDYIDTHKILDGGSSHTYEAWIKPYSTTPDFQGVIGDWWWAAAGGNKQMNLGLNYGKLYGALALDATTNSVTSDDTLSINNWYHVALVYNISAATNNLKLYLNGKLVNTTTATTTSDVASYSARVGLWRVSSGATDSRPFNGLIDEVRIWNKSLSAEEIKEQYYSNLNKYDSDKWNLYVNQSYDVLSAPHTFNYSVNGEDKLGMYNTTETRHLNLLAPFTFQIVTTGTPETFSFQTDNAVGLYVDWNDSSNDTYSGTGLRSHQYATPGVYNITLRGEASRVSFYEGTPTLLVDILTPMSNSVTGINSSYQMFRGCTGITNFTAEDWFDEASENVTDMSLMFISSQFNQNISNWDVSNVTDMYGMFGYSSFDQDTSSWDTSSVIDMSYMFFSSPFNQNISNWDTSNVADMSVMFSSSQFNQNISNWDVSKVTNMYSMFSSSPFNQNISNWDVSNVVNMGNMFSNSSFNQNISNWDVSNVTDMPGMFSSSPFNQNISNWDVSNVTNMNSMFQSSSFNQNISNWDTSSVTSMNGMFENSSFTQNISNWNTSSVIDMSYMFSSSPFNQNISNWDVSNVTNMNTMFRDSQFNQNISNWDTSSVTNMYSMFSSSQFNQNISNWNTSSVITMYYMFANSQFNQNISNWNTSSVGNMKDMFSSSQFNQNISNWDVSSVTLMRNMFYNSSFNQNISNWDTSNVIDMGSMFQNSSFDQNISNWDVSSVRYMDSMFNNSGLSIENYSSLLIGWNSLPSLYSGVTLDAPGIKYLPSAASARQNIINTHSWTINDAGMGINGFTFQINMTSLGDFKFQVDNSVGTYMDCGNGTGPFLISDDSSLRTCSYGSSGVYNITVNGQASRIAFGETGATPTYLIDILTNMSEGLSGITSTKFMFKNAENITNFTAQNWFDDVSGNVTDMSYMFQGATNFNGNVSAWDTSKVTDMNSMFYGAASFNQPLNSWNTSKVTDMQFMFDNTPFNYDLDSWDTSKVQKMNYMFGDAINFNSNISTWDTTSVSNMIGMFYNATSFNQPLNSWEVGGVIKMSEMFHYATSFNQPLDNWDTSNVGGLMQPGADMMYMFENASSFDQNLSTWDVSLSWGFNEMFSGSGLSTENYSSLLIGWNGLGSLRSGMTLDALGIKYLLSAASARQNIIDTYSWTINDAGMAPLTGFTFQINMTSPGDFKFQVDDSVGTYMDCGNGTGPFLITDGSSLGTCSYGSSGVYNITLNGEASRIAFGETGTTPTLLIDILTNMSDGLTGINSSYQMFRDCTGITNFTAEGFFDEVSGNVTDMSYMFYGASSFDQSLNSWNTSEVSYIDYIFYQAYDFNQSLNNWDISKVTNMQDMFFYATDFNGNISNWNVSNVTIMQETFLGAIAFNQDISSWDVSSVTNMDGMFYNADSFNQDISSWDTSSVTNMAYLFYSNDAFNKSINIWNTSNVVIMTYAFSNMDSFNQPLNNWDTSKVKSMERTFFMSSNFNQPLNNWDTSSVITMRTMFNGATSFNGNISTWDTSSVTIMDHMFSNANSFNQPLNNWDTSKVSDMSWMFQSADSFNQSLNNWNVSSVITMYGMFYDVDSFNQSLNNWDTSKVINMKWMFYNSLFNQNISNWDVSSVTNMYQMFWNATSFNQNISNWDTSSVTDMRYMFQGATSFDQNLSNWNVSSLAQADNMFSGVTLSTPNYDSLLIGWAGNLVLQNGTVFSGGNSKYSLAAVSARNDTLIGYWNWSITDGGMESVAPNIPVVNLTSVGSYNYTNEDLNCTFFVFDNDSTELNATVEWIQDGSVQYVSSANNSYTNGTLVSVVLNSGNTTKHENWSCSVRLNDGYLLSGWGNSSNLTINNHLPFVTLISPDDGNATTDRTPTFTWSVTDYDGDLFFHEFNMTGYYGANPTVLDGRSDGGVGGTSFTPSTDLQLLYDNGYHYEWRVRASDGEGSGEWSEVRTINITAEVGIILLDDEIYFGNLAVGESNSTDHPGIDPFVVENNGTVKVNVSVNASQLWNERPASSSEYQFKVNETLETPSFNLVGSIMNWFNMPLSGYVVAVNKLNYSDSVDTAEVGINLTVPLSEAPGQKESTVVFLAELAE